MLFSTQKKRARMRSRLKRPPPLRLTVCYWAVMSRSRKYPEELLERGVRLALESGRPIAHVAADLGIHSETLRKRVRQAEAD